MSARSVRALARRGATTATTAPTETASSPVPSTVAHAAAKEAHQLGEESTWVATLASMTAAAHASNVLSLRLHCQLTAPE